MKMAFFESITQEIKALQNRIRHFIGDAHWLSDGEWKESVIRTMLKRNLPQNYAIGKGFVIAPKYVSTQIDILIYSNDKPVLHREGDFSLVTPDAVEGIIEVKTKLNTNELRDAIDKILKISNHIFEQQMRRPFVGIFAYENNSVNYEAILDHIESKATEIGLPTINAICIGDSGFLRYWDEAIEGIGKKCYWRAYPELNNMAPAYFLHNTVEYLCKSDYFKNVGVWYPTSEKEETKFYQKNRQIGAST